MSILKSIISAFLAFVALSWLVNHFSDDIQIVGWASEWLDPLPLVVFILLCIVIFVPLVWLGAFICTAFFAIAGAVFGEIL